MSDRKESKMHTLSPQAAKSIENAQARDRLWRPTLSRTSTKLTLQHAANNRRGQRQETARVMKDLGWCWDGKRRWFYADLSAQNLNAVLDAWTTSVPRILHINLSKGVRQYRDRLRDQALPVEHIRGKSKLFKS